jgi:hypothetical protein
MFEIVEIGSLDEKRKLWKQRWRSVKLKVVEKCSCEYLERSFEGYQTYSVQTYRAEFAEGTVVTVCMGIGELIAIGDKFNVETLAGKGYLKSYFRMVGNRY